MWYSCTLYINLTVIACNSGFYEINRICRNKLYLSSNYHMVAAFFITSACMGQYRFWFSRWDGLMSCSGVQPQ